MNEVNVKEARARIDALDKIATARGRRERAGVEIRTEDKIAKVENARMRAEGYLRVRDHLKHIVEESCYGISAEELESVEFICEQLNELSKAVWIESVNQE